MLQRLGEAPLDEARTPVELNLLDGETVYLRPRANQLPPVSWDDLIDGLADQVRARSDSWTPRQSRWMLLAGAATALLTGLLLLLLETTAATGAQCAGGTALVLLVSAVPVARVLRDSVTATVLAGVATGYAMTAGWLAPVALDPAASTATRLAGAAVAAVAALSMGLTAVADAALLFIGALTFMLLLVVPALVGALSSLSAGQVAAIGLAVSLVFSMFVSVTAFRLGGLALPALPTTAEELQEDIDPVPYEFVVERAAATASYQTGLQLALGAAQLIQTAVLIGSGGGWEVIMAGAVALLLFLRSRHLDGAVQRWSVLVVAGVTVALELLHIAAWQAPFVRLTEFWTMLLVLALGLLVASSKLPGKRLRPYWGRAVDIFESITAIAVLPLLLAVLNVYQMARGVSG